MKIVLWIIGSLLGIGVLAAASESDTTTPDIAVPNQSINLVNNEITSPRPIPTDDKREIVPEINSSNCDRNYSGCVPIATDVDCMGGSGNGPEYVRGPIEVIGKDIYGLDRDNDGIACE